MAPDNRPTGRKKNVLGGSADVKKRGSGLGTGPVGAPGSRPHTGGSGTMRSGGGMGKLPLIVVAVIALLGGSVGRILGCNGSQQESSYEAQQQSGSSSASQSETGGQGSADAVSALSSLLGAGSFSEYYAGNTQNSSQGNSPGTLFQTTQSTGTQGYGNTSYSKLNTVVDERAREKRTVIKGGGEDIITILVYLCGTDLESKHGMATADLMEMTAAKLSDKVNLIVYTGGCKSWQNKILSNSVNQIYQVTGGGVKCLEKDMGNKAMTDPATLTEFISYGGKNFPADRYELILWDHGGGSISGYGYDEKNRMNGSMTLSGINEALKNSGMIFDFIGFDTCLMASLENALMLSEYADYMIASEETEPGVGWYYTNWLTELSKNTSMPTVEIGKNIIDDFVDVCNKKCRGQKTTLSLVDLSELSQTVPEELKDFARSTSELINEDKYKVVSDARYNTREFAQSSKIDQVDLVDFSKKLNTAEGNELAQTIINAVKYNKTSQSITNAYGISAYFPLKKMSKVDQAADIYDDIGMDSEYTSCIKNFASLQLGGQAAGSSPSSPLPSLLGTLIQSASSLSGSSQQSTMMSLFGGMLSGNFGNVAGMTQAAAGFLNGRSFDDASAEKYIKANSLDASKLVWTFDTDEAYKLMLTEKEWGLIHDLDLNVFYDDGEGYIDLGLDNVFDYDEKGNLIGAYDNTWLSINSEVVAYYHTDTVNEEGKSPTISGYVPALLNGERVKLLLVFDDENPDGYISGAVFDYKDSTDAAAKNMIALCDGDSLQFLCDYYSYEGEYLDSYLLGDPITVSSKDGIVIGNIDIGSNSEYKPLATYRITDIYEQTYWTEVIP